MFILLIILFIPVVFYFGFLGKVYFGLKSLRRTMIKNDKKCFVSVIIPFRNESEVIIGCLKSLEAQTYPIEQFEIIFVNDFSDDDSVAKLISEKTLPNIHVISVPADFQKMSPKKRGIKYGIDNSKGEFIVTTDADCVHKREWLATMVSAFNEQTGFISGPVRFSDSDKLLNQIQQLEFGGLILTGAGLIGSHKPTICSAANIAFRKEAFEYVHGYEDNQHLSSGDDELLMQKIAKSKKYEVQFNFSEQAIVETNANNSIDKFIQQRKRWASKGLFYNDKILIFQLIMIFLFFVNLPLQLLLGATVDVIFFYSFLLIFLSKGIVEFFIIREGIPLLYKKINFKVFAVSEILHIPYIIYSGIAGALGNFKWKGRNLKR